jgi:IS605 OrfB family transposase
MKIVRSTKLSLKFLNKQKREQVHLFIDEYRRVGQIICDQLWNIQQLPKFIDIKTLNVGETWLGNTSLQCVAKQISAIIKGTKKSGRALNKIPTKPNVQEIQPELDARFITLINFDKNESSFDGWVSLRCLGNKLKIIFPLKKTKHFNKLSSKGILRNCVRLTKKDVHLMFDFEVERTTSQNNVGIDIGIVNVVSLSSDQVISKHPHKWTLSKILQKLSRQKKGSKNFKQTQDLRENFIGWSINKINFDNIGSVSIENIKDLRHGKKCDRFRSHWTYTQIFNRLNMKAESLGVQVTKVDPRNTSRKCSKCGEIDKYSRKGKKFKCTKCGFELDADLNASKNIKFLGRENTIPYVDENNLERLNCLCSLVNKHNF